MGLRIRTSKRGIDHLQDCTTLLGHLTNPHVIRVSPQIFVRWPSEKPCAATIALRVIGAGSGLFLTLRMWATFVGEEHVDPGFTSSSRPVKCPSAGSPQSGKTRSPRACSNRLKDASSG